LTEEGYVEIPIDQIYSATREAAVSAIRESGARIATLSISSQGQTFVSLDEHDEPLHSAILWYDARASEQADRLRHSLQSANLPKVMPGVAPISTAPKIMWLREHFPGLMACAKRHLLLPNYLAYRLTGRAVTDPSTASSTALYVKDTEDYCPEALAAAEICQAALAEIQKPGQPIGRVLPKSAEQWGLDADTMVVTGPMTNTREPWGQAIAEPASYR
jgi:xylulokinase